MSQFSGPGGVGIPRFYLVDANGKVVGNDIPNEKALEKLLRDVADFKLDRKLHQSLAPAVLDFRRGALGPSFLFAQSFLASPDKALAADAKYLHSKIAKREKYAKKRVLESANDAPHIRYGKLIGLKHELAGLELGKWASAQLKAFRKNREYMAHAEIKRRKTAWRSYEAALKREIKGKSAYDRKRVRQLYTELLSKHARSHPAKLAKTRLAKLEREGSGKAESGNAK